MHVVQTFVPRNLHLIVDIFTYMTFLITEVLNFVIFIPALIGLIRFSKISPIYRPFIYCIWIGLINETASYLIIEKMHSNFMNANIYMFVESILFIWQFKNWRLFERRNWMFVIIISIITLGWIAESVIFSSPFMHFDSYFLIAYSFILSLLSVSLISRIISKERGNMLKNSAFLICIAFIIFYMVSVLSESFWVYGLSENKEFRINVAYIRIIANLVANILYSLAILWMPIKEKYTLPF